MPVPPYLIPKLLVSGQNCLIATPQDHWPFFARLLVAWNPLDLIAFRRVTDPMPVRSLLARLNRVSRLRFGAADADELIPVGLVFLGADIHALLQADDFGDLPGLVQL